MKPSELLSAARHRLWDGVSERAYSNVNFICSAIDTVNTSEHTDVVTKEHTWRIAKEVKMRIKQRIYPCDTLYFWLRDQGIPDGDITDARLQAHRLAWVDILIAEFESEGK